ncbi:MAG: OB-fold domain-containing protein [Actinomycetes bacterium]
MNTREGEFLPPIDRMLPNPSGLNADFYRIAAETGTINIQRCSDCSVYRHPPRFRCAECGSDAWSWSPTSMRGVVWSWTITHRAIDPAFTEQLPYAVVVVEMEEGVRVVGNLRSIEISELRIGLPVSVALDKRSEALALIDFTPR